MKKIVLLTLIVAVVFLGLILGPKLVQYDGYVLVVMEHGTLQLRVFGVLLLLVGLFLIGWLTLWLVKNLIRVFSGSRSWFSTIGGHGPDSRISQRKDDPAGKR